MVRFSSHLLHSRFNPLTVCVFCALRAVKQQRPRYLEPGFRDVGAAAPKRIGQPAGIPLKAAHDAAGFKRNRALKELRSYELKEHILLAATSRTASVFNSATLGLDGKPGPVAMCLSRGISKPNFLRPSRSSSHMESAKV